MNHKLDEANSKKIGKYIGPVLSLLFLSELVTLHIYNTPANAHTVYLNGFVLLLVGFYLVRVHNVWTKRWPVLITLSAWAITIMGVYRLFFPEAPQAPVSATAYIFIAILLIIEVFVTVKSYTK